MNIFIFGLGYSARYFAAGLAGARIVGATRRTEAVAPRGSDFEILRFDREGADPVIPARLAESDTLLISVPPGQSGDPVLAHFREAIATSHWRAIVYLSTVGVYGDHQGAWVDEASAPRQNSARSLARLAAEEAWRVVAARANAPLHILRLAGIYGPGRNALVNLREGRAHRIIKPGQVFNRIHVADIAQAVERVIGASEPGAVWNVADDEPAPPQDVVAFAAELLDVSPPKEVPFDRAEMSPMARSFYEDNKRVANAKLKRKLGFKPLYPTYREGLAALAAAGEGRRA